MTEIEASNKFNDLLFEHRIIIIANQCTEEIRMLEREKENYIKQHKQNMKRINDRIKVRSKWLDEL